MKLRNTLILVVIALALGGVALFVDREAPPPAEPGSTPTPTPGPKLLAVSANDVRGVRVARGSSSEKTVLTRGDDGPWRLLEPRAEEADAYRVGTFVDTLASVQPSRVLTGTLNLADYGLAPAAMVVTLSMKDGTQRVVEIGDMNVDRSAYYARLDADETHVYLISSYVGADAENMLTTPPVQPTSMPEPTATAGS